MKLVCPYCFSSIDSSKLNHRCPDGHITKDISLVERISRKVKCKTCGKFAPQKICPKCEENLPNDMSETPNLLFSIVGISGSGKTNYITVMLEELNNTANLRLALSYQTIETRNIHRENRKLIYEDHQKPKATTSGAAAPQIWRIKNLKQQFGDTVQTYTFSIFDGAGEDHENLDMGSRECRYIEVSEAIMVVIDPMALQSVKRSLDKDTYEKSTASVGGQDDKNSTDVVNNIAAYIKAIRGIGANRKINVPVAVIFTKMDALMRDFRNRPVSQPSPHANLGCFQFSDSRAVDSDIRSWLQSNGEMSFINALEANFSDFVFFGVSSYGSVPITRDNLAPVHPHRVLDPILWFFAKKKFIEAQ